MAYLKTKRFTAQALLIVLTVVLGINTAFAVPEEQWPNTASPSAIKVNDDSGNTHFDDNPVIARTSDGNFVIAWVDQRNGNQDIFIQKVSSADGSDLWSSSDVVVTNATGPQPEENVLGDSNISIESDSNGTIITFDSDNGATSDIFIQKINDSGVAQWTANGVQLSTDGTPASNFEFAPRMVLDGSGGAFASWTAVDNVFSSSRVWVAHINSSGTIDQGPTELAHSGSPFDIAQDIISDGSGGVIALYTNTDLGSAGNVLALRLDSTLTPVAGWNSGTAVAVTDGGDLPLGFNVAKAITDGSGGTIIAYTDPPSQSVKAQRLNSSGVEQWGSGTSTTIVSGNWSESLDIVSDGSGGAVIVWTDGRAANTDVYAQRVNSSGAVQWTANGVPASDTTDGQDDATDTRAASYTVEGSTIIGFMGNGETEARLQKLDDTGAKEYGAGGLTLDTGGISIQSVRVASDENQGAGVTWHQVSANADIYAQYVADPPPGPPPAAITDLAATAGNGEVTLSWTEPNDNGSAITGYTVEYGIGGFGNTCVDASCTDSTAGATVPGLTNFGDYQFRVYATNANGTSAASNTATAVPNQCIPLAFNDDSGGPTVSESCLGLSVSAGTLSLENIPDDFTFPIKFSSTQSQDSFSNDNAATTNVDVITGPGNILTVADLRNSGGFDVTITSTVFETATSDEITLDNLYIATTCPDGDDLSADLYGSPNNCDNTNGAEFADGSSDTGNMSQGNTVHSDNATGTATNSTELDALRNAYLNDGLSFDENTDSNPDVITLMESTGARVARLSQAINFYLNIPASQASGTYNVAFTIDLIPN